MIEKVILALVSVIVALWIIGLISYWIDYNPSRHWHKPADVIFRAHSGGEYE